jgi:dipicolinate synthase subunit A
MKNKYKIAVVGGDMRQYAASKEICRAGFDVYAYALCVEDSEIKNINFCHEINDALDGARAVILPLPVSTDNKVLNCPVLRNSERIALSRIVELMEADSVLFGGRIPAWLVMKAQEKGIKVVDYFLSEKLQIKNAYITAEAAMSIAMNSLDKCLKDARVVITGSGRISRILAELLRRMDTEVTVAARNSDSLVYFELNGCRTIKIENGETGSSHWYDELRSGYDIIFNTVPHKIISADILENISDNTVIIDLASKPGGVDFDAANKLGKKAIWALSLPGKVAPQTAGKVISDTINNILGEIGIPG